MPWIKKVPQTDQETPSLGDNLIKPGKLPVDVDELTTVETVDSGEVGITK